ncbi:MAG: hypothetical protein LCH67_06865 [Bacteroidetes bacterium]|nr:hypothetical protein [Bacteroidota bacterium]
MKLSLRNGDSAKTYDFFSISPLCGELSGPYFIVSNDEGDFLTFHFSELRLKSPERMSNETLKKLENVFR